MSEKCAMNLRCGGKETLTTREGKWMENGFWCIWNCACVFGSVFGSVCVCVSMCVSWMEKLVKPHFASLLCRVIRFRKKRVSVETPNEKKKNNNKKVNPSRSSIQAIQVELTPRIEIFEWKIAWNCAWPFFLFVRRFVLFCVKDDAFPQCVCQRVKKRFAISAISHKRKKKRAGNWLNWTSRYTRGLWQAFIHATPVLVLFVSACVWLCVYVCVCLLFKRLILLLKWNKIEEKNQIKENNQKWNASICAIIARTALFQQNYGLELRMRLRLWLF